MDCPSTGFNYRADCTWSTKFDPARRIPPNMSSDVVNFEF